MSNASDPAPNANLWLRTRTMLVRAGDEIGAARTLVLETLTNARRRRVASFIALIETIIRKLLFAEAAALLAAAPAGAARPAPLKARKQAQLPNAGRPAFDPTRSETWRVRFALKPPRDPSRSENVQPAQPKPPRARRKLMPAPQRLAMRLEALRRVLADPAPHARRLARIFPRLCRRYPGAAMRYALATAYPHRSDDGDPRLIVEAMSLAYAAASIFLNSS